jgi:hypothetical protein
MFLPIKSWVFSVLTLAWSLLNLNAKGGFSKRLRAPNFELMRHTEDKIGATSRGPSGQHGALTAKRRAPDEISELLRALNLYDSRIAEPVLSELTEVLTADYRRAPGLPTPEMARQLAGIAKSCIDPRHRAWKKWRTSEDYRVRLEFGSRDIAVHAEPYTRGAGLLLWGFSCDARIGESGAFVIFLNTAHQPGAVAATVAHELGHFIHRSIAPESCAAMAPLAANFATHLEDGTELFSDSLAALSAYSTDAVREGLRLRKPSRVAAGKIDEVIHALTVIDPEYRIDFAHKSVSPAWRVRYLAATIHFYKLRKALLETAGI